MNVKGFNHPVYQKYFGNLRNVRIVPQDKQDKKPEREKVHYPLVKEIAVDNLARFEGFDSYIQKNILILNNLRIYASRDEGREIRTWHKKNPDITVLTSQGQITVIECKQEALFFC